MSSTHPRELSSIVEEVRQFANAAAEAARLPGIGNGPGDAFRHLVGAAELVRRIGLVPASVILEANETKSWVEQASRDPGYPSGLGAEERKMDRTNNPIGARIGLRAQTPSEVLDAAWFEIMRAHQRGPGVDGAATWLRRSQWRDRDEMPGDNWPPRERPSLMDVPAIAAYRGHLVPPRHPAEPDGTPVWVQPHLRDGHRVRGHFRPSLD